MNDKKNREPMVIALATGKGGSMKTTSAVFLARAPIDWVLIDKTTSLICCT